MKRLIFLMLSCLLLAGCWDVNEPERLMYIFGLGIDYKDEEYIIHAQIIDFSNIAKSDQPTNPEAIQVEVGTAKGSTPSEAFYKLYKAIDEKMFWGHFAFVVLSESALKEGRATMLINTFIRFHETRYNSWVYSTKEDVHQIMLTTPIINKAISLSKLADPLNSYKQNSFVEPMDFRKILINLNEPGHEAIVPLVTTYKQWETPKQKDTSAEIKGVAIITPDEFKGFLENHDAAGLQWLSKDSVRSSITTETQNHGKISINLDSIRPEIKPVINSSNIQFDISVSVNAALSGFQGSASSEVIKQAVKKQVEKEIRHTFAKGLELDADVYRLSEVVYRHHLRDWKKLQKNGKIELNENSIRNVNITVAKVSAGRKKFAD